MELLDKEHYLNIIELLKRALEFYADEKQYTGSHPRIELDGGVQAQFALNSVAAILKQTQEMGDNIDELMKSYGTSSEEVNINPMEKFMEEIEKLKKSGNKI